MFFQRLSTFLTLFLLKIGYVFLIVEMLPTEYLSWDYEKYVHLDAIWFELVLFMIAFAVFQIGFYENNPFSFFSELLFIFSFIPNNSTLSLCNYKMAYYLSINSYYIFFFCVLSFFAIRFQKDDQMKDMFSIKKLFTDPLKEKKKDAIMNIFLIVIAFFAISYVYQYNGLDFSILSSDMYETRASYADFMEVRFGSFFSYMTLILFGILNFFLPIFLYNSIQTKRWLNVVLIAFVYLCLFIMEMQKASLIAPLYILILSTYLIYFKNIKLVYLLPYAFLLLYLFVWLDYYFFDDSLLFHLFVNRISYMPTYLTHLYYEYFSVNECFWMRRDFFLVSNVLSKVFGTVGEYGAVKSISLYFFSGGIPSPNTGLFAEAFCQFGSWGIVIHPILICIMLYYTLKASLFYNWRLSFIIFFYVCIMLSGNQLFISFRFVSFLLFFIITYFFSYITKGRS